MGNLYYRRLPTGELAAASTESNGNSDNLELRVYVIDSVDARLMGGLEAATTAMLQQLEKIEPCGPAHYAEGYSDPWQKRPGRRKNKSPYRVAKRRRRKQLAKETQKLMRLAEKRREAERAKLAAKK